MLGKTATNPVAPWTGLGTDTENKTRWVMGGRGEVSTHQGP